MKRPRWACSVTDRVVSRARRFLQASAAHHAAALTAAIALVVLAVASTPVAWAAAAPVAAQSLHDNSDTPPPDEAAWVAQSFPDNWSQSRRGVGGTVWYRIDYRVDDPAPVYAIYLPRVSMNAAVYVNGLLIGTGGSFREPVARNWNRPLYFLVPPGVLKAGANRVHLRVRGYSGLDGGLTEPVLDTDAAIGRVYERALFLRIILAQTTSLLIGAVGAFMVLLWIRRRQDAAFGYFGFASLLWAFYTADLYVRDIPLPTFYWEILIRSAFHAFALLLALFATDYAGEPDRRWHLVRTALWTMMALVPLSFFFGGADALFALSHFWNITTFVAVSAASAAALRTAWRRRSWEALMLVAIGFLTIAFALHDVLIKGGWIADDRVNLLMYAAPPLFFGIGWLLTDRFIRTLAEVETLNRDLEARVVEKTAALEANYSRLAQAERAQALAEERQRLMRDMHDGVGGQLITALAALESGRAAPSDVAGIVRECIDDLRLVIDSMEPIDNDLLALLGALRYRIEPRLTAAGIRLAWRVRELPPVPNLTPRNALHVLRILQEALTNVLKHAGARIIIVRTRVDEGRAKAFIEVEDDGTGFPVDIAAASARGRGIANMRRRAEAVGGSLSIASGANGTTVSLALPLNVQPVLPSARADSSAG